MAVALAIASAPIALYVGSEFAVVWLTYLFITLAYSAYLKRVAILDILTLSILYSTRIVAGGVAIDVQLSFWLLSFSIFFFFFLATIKRFGEIKEHAAREKLEIAGRGYRTEDLPAVSMIAVSSGFVSVVVLALYVSSPDVVVNYSSPEFLWGACATLMFWVSYIVLVTNRGEMHDDPIVFALKDRTSLICLLVVLGFATAAVRGGL